MDRLTQTPSQPAGAAVPTFRSEAREDGYPGGNKLGLGVDTAKVHVAHLFAALGERSRIEAVAKSRALNSAHWKPRNDIHDRDDIRPLALRKQDDYPH
jgi:hypothetical protein